MNGSISKIQHFSLDDGPGIRTTVFLRGCNLSCKWCHNPECIPTKNLLLYYNTMCIGCGACADICENGVHHLENGVHTVDRTNCSACGKCAAVCAAGALELNAAQRSADQVLSEILQDRPFYERSGGGLTVSGGDPMLQPDFLRELLELAHSAGIHTAVDTAGLQAFAQYEQVLPYTDLFLYDVKLFTPETHKLATGVDNALILENLPRLLSRGARVWVRVPLIPEYHTDEELTQIAAYLKPLAVERIDLLPYHKYGIRKYEALGRAYEISREEPSRDWLDHAAAFFRGARAAAFVK